MSENSSSHTERIERLGERPPERFRRREEGERPKWVQELPIWLQDSEKIAAKYGYSRRWWFYARFYTLWEKLQRPIPVFINYKKAYQENVQFILSNYAASNATGVTAGAAGGVGKTIIATLLGIILKKTKHDVIIYDADQSNPGVMMRLHLDDAHRHTIGGAAWAKRLSQGWTPQNQFISQMTAFDAESGVMVIPAEGGILMDEDDTIMVAEEAKKVCHTLIADTEPGASETRFATIGLVNVADVVVTPGLAESSKELEAISKTLNYTPFNLRNDDGKVASHVLIVIDGVPEREYNLKTHYEMADRYGVPPKQIALVPFSQYIKGGGNFRNISKISEASLDERMLYGVSELGRAFTVLAMERNDRKKQQYVARTEQRQASASVVAHIADTSQYQQTTVQTA